MKKEIAKRIVNMAKKTADKGVGGSWSTGVYEIKPPAELMRQRKSIKK